MAVDVLAMSPRAISEALKVGPDAEPTVVLLFSPEQGGWHTGVWWDGSWRLYYDLSAVLNPTHWLPAPAGIEILTNSVLQLAWKLEAKRTAPSEAGA